ncbi:MAG: DUF389 domain-containing protein [Acidimicrobiia bacterium]
MGDNDRTADALPGPEEITGELEPVAPPTPETPTEPDAAARSDTTKGLGKVLFTGLLGVVIVFAIALDPNNTLRLEEIVAILLILFGTIEAVSSVRNGDRLDRYIQPAVAIGAGVAIWIWPDETRRVVGLILGAVILLRGVIDTWSGLWRRNQRGTNMWVFVRGLILIAMSGLVLLIPSAAVPVAVIGGALLLIVRAVLGVWYVVSRRTDDLPIDPGDTYAIVAYILSSRDLPEEDVHRIDDIVFIRRIDPKQRITRFAVLMALATTIATFGIAVDSTAVVIGAMLIAPLMTPILGVSAGLINGRSRAAMDSSAVVAGGAIGAVALAWALSALIPNLAEVVENSQVVSRTAPSLLDLAIAVAAGIAGAYGVSKAETSDALPGVAVAIALVPPLAVIGITLHAEDLNQAAGASLLFLTNLFAIILMAGLVFLIVGYGSWSRLHYRRDRIRTSFALVVLGVILISIPLALTARKIFTASNDTRNASAAVSEWLSEEFPGDEVTPLRINAIEVNGDVVTVQLIGWVVPPPTDRLSEIVSDRVGRSMGAVVRWIEEQIDFTPESDPTEP